MPDRGWRADRGHRPPWWPEGEAWPPPAGSYGPPWRRTRRRFLLRLAVFVAVLVFLAVGGGTLAFLLLSSVFRFGEPGSHPWPLFPLALIVVVVLIVGALRRAAGPVGDLIEAASRVESGDYSARVPERGAPEIRGLVRAFNRMSGQLAADREQRRRLLADVSHELRTPLAVIQGNLEGLQDGVYPPDARHLGLLLDETRLLGRLVDDLRTISLAEAGELPLHREPTDLGALLVDAVASLRATAAAAGIDLQTEVPADPSPVEVDPVRIREVVGNLVANAVRHTPSGGRIDVRLRWAQTEALVEVADTGEGMAPELAARAFERFSRDPGSGGSGLGLPIARELVAAHGGSITLASAPGAGTTVRFTLPLR